MTRFLILLLVLLEFQVNAQSCEEISLTNVKVRASDTDASIAWELKQHFVYINTICNPRNELLVHLVGSFDNPTSTELFPKLAANNGYHVISLAYKNNVAARSACGNSDDANCYEHYRKEIILGGDLSSKVEVDLSNSIENRLTKLLVYLDANYMDQNWGQYLKNDTVTWSQVAVSGHSQGGGHAVMLGALHNLKRVMCFSSPNDYSDFFDAPANWLSQDFKTPRSSFYGFNNLKDDVVDFNKQYEVWEAMDFIGDSTNIDLTSLSFDNSHRLYTTYDTSQAVANHSATLLDDKTPKDEFGNPVFYPVWKYMLSIDDVTGINSFVDNKLPQLLIYPNPANDLLNIEIGGDVNLNTIKVVDSKGVNILVNYQFERGQLIVETGALRPGPYVINLFFEDRSETVSFIKD